MIWDRRKELVSHWQPIGKKFPSHRGTFRPPRARPTPSHERRDGEQQGQPQLDAAPRSPALTGVLPYTTGLLHRQHLAEPPCKNRELKKPNIKGISRTLGEGGKCCS